MLSTFFSESVAYAQIPGEGPSGPAALISFAPFILIFGLFYFLLMRPQQQKAKQRKEMIKNLKKGDRVMTTGGLMGTVVNLATDVLTLQVADGVRVKVKRAYTEEIEEAKVSEVDEGGA